MTKRTLKLPWLLVGSLITNTGISFIWPLTTIYMHEYLHEPLTTSGIVLFLNSLATMVGNAVGGRLFDRWRPYPTMLLGIGIDVVTTGALVVCHGWPAYPLLLVGLGFGNGIVATGINAYATKVSTKKASYVFNVLYFMANLGLVIGTLIVGFVLPLGITYVFGLAFALFVIFFFVALRHFNLPQPPHAAGHAPKQVATRNPYRLNVALILLTLFLTWVTYEQWQSNISTFMLKLGMTVRDYSFLWTFNAVLIVILQPVLTAFDDWLLVHIRLRLGVGFTLFAGSFLLLLVARHYAVFVLAMGILTCGEVLALPAVSTYVDLYSPAGQQGRYQGYVQMFASAGRAVGPLIGALIIEATSYRVLFISLVAVLAVAVATFSWYASQAQLRH
jgi:MFS family permease